MILLREGFAYLHDYFPPPPCLIPIGQSLAIKCWQNNNIVYVLLKCVYPLKSHGSMQTLRDI